jgi:hypothetical protein
MAIEINELIVNATIDDGRISGNHQISDDQCLNIEELKTQIISECKDLFYELLDKQGDR